MTKATLTTAAGSPVADDNNSISAGPRGQEDEDYYTQAGDLFRVMNDDQKDQLASNIAGGLVHATESAREPMLAQYAKADPDYAARVSVAMTRLMRPD